MLAIYATALLILGASLLIGRTICGLAGWPRPIWLSGATGFAVLVFVSPFLLRLPGRATTAAIVLGLVLIACAVGAVREIRGAGGPGADRGRDWLIGVAVVVVVLAVASIPFAVNDRVGVLGEGIYTNDHAAQLYWADWLQHGFGPEPSAVSFGYPIGPQAVAVVAAEATGASLVSSFNGLLLAIPALTALTALAGLRGFGGDRRVAIAAICGLPYLGASFLAQSAFKETAMALFLLAFAVALQAAPRPADDRVEDAGPDPGPPVPWRAIVVIGLILAVASVFTFSLPGLVWFAVALPLWLVIEELSGHSPIEWRRIRDAVLAHRRWFAAAALVLIAIAVLAFGPATNFVNKINDVQESTGRLSSPVFPGEALGIWPQGDYRIVRGEVSGSLIATALGAIAVLFGVVALVRRRQWALLATLLAGGIVYLGARRFAQIHVEAKALMVIAPLVLFVSLRALLAPTTRDERRPWKLLRYALGTTVVILATLSTLLALRAAPIGYDDRQQALEQLADQAAGKPVAFLGVDRFAGYYLRDTLARAPAGYVPEEVEARPEKTWTQGIAADFDTLDSGKLDKFDYAITTSAAFASAPPPNFEEVDRAGDYILWERTGPTPRSRVLPAEDGNPGAKLDCADGEGRRISRRRGTADVIPEPAVGEYTAWKTPPPVTPASGGQERGWAAPGTASIELHLAAPGSYGLSLQYHSQVPLEVMYQGEPIAHLPASLDGMYLSAAGRGAYWPAGSISVDHPGRQEVEIAAAEPNGLQDTIGADRRVWLGNLAATSDAGPETVPIREACRRYVDHFELARRGKGG